MRHRFANFAEVENGSAVFDWLILMTGVVLMAVSILIAVIPVSGDVADDGLDRVDQVEDTIPA